MAVPPDPESTALPSELLPMVNETVPVGVLEPLAAVTVAVTTADPLLRMIAGFAARVVVVAVTVRPDQVVISAQNRNFPGRSGPGQMYLASPLTVAASAVAVPVALTTPSTGPTLVPGAPSAAALRLFRGAYDPAGL